MDITDIPQKYNCFPSGYINDVRGWGFDRGTIEGRSGELLTLDMDFGTRCSLNCPFCFRRSNSVDSERHALPNDHISTLIDEARAIGLRSVKFLGAGEPLENRDFLHLLRELAERDIVPIVFTKTGLLGDDGAVARLYSNDGITTGRALAGTLFDLGASVVLGFNSFDPNVQSRMVGNGNDYVVKRDRALISLLDAGFADCCPTRLALGINPVTHHNIRDAFEVYKWARHRNMYAIVTPTMISGRAKGNAWQLMSPPDSSILDLYVRIYEYNIATGLQTMEQIAIDGISAYAGGHPCNQVACGLYVSLNGVVMSCPGSEELLEGNVWDKSLEQIWLRSHNFQRRGTFNCGCIAKDGKSIPSSLYSDVMTRLMSTALPTDLAQSDLR